ncbi:hypothetical protein G6F40_017734 [Rhizopus arrhizus]|nr:hypothetical protein G6F40_017734 [Rhizopus arrhizus]
MKQTAAWAAPTSIRRPAWMRSTASPVPAMAAWPAGAWPRATLPARPPPASTWACATACRPGSATSSSTAPTPG